MKTFNFDLLLEIKEDLINRAFATAFYTSAFPTIANGTLVVSQKVPDEMKDLGNVDFEFRLLEPPTVDAINEDTARLLFNIEFSLSLMQGLHYEFDITLTITAVPTLETKQQHLMLSFKEGKIDEVVFNDKSKIPAKAIKAVDKVIAGILKTHLLDKLKDINLTPFLEKVAIPDAIEGIDAALLWNNGKAFFFKGERFIQYDVMGKKADDGFPLSINQGWSGIWDTGIDAAMVYNNDKAYFFKEEKYIRYDIATHCMDSGYPRKIADGWKNVWADGIDAAVMWNNGKAYFFKGHEYIRYDIAADRADNDYPKDIAGNWQGVWPDGIDSVVLWNNSKAYFFKGDEYIRYDVAADKADTGFPKKTGEDWEGIWYDKLPLPTKLNGFKMLNQCVFTAGLNFFDNPGGNISAVTDYTDKNDLWLGVREKAMHQIFDHVWANTATHLKRKHWGGTYNVISDNVLDYINKFDDVLLSKIPNLLTGGFLEENKVTVDYLKCDASATLSIEKPSFDMRDGNKIDIGNLKVNLHLYLRVYTQITKSTTVDTSGWFPDILTPWEDDIVSSSTTNFNLIDCNYNPSVTLSNLETELICDMTKGVLAKIRKLKVYFDLSNIDLIDDILNWLVNQLTALVLPLIPPIRLLPPVIKKNLLLKSVNISINKDLFKLNVIDYVVPKELNVQVGPDEITSNEEELTIATNLSISGMPRTVFSLPLFVANCNPRRMEVHRIDCSYVEDIDQAYRIGYYILNDSLHDGFDGCKYCLPEYHTR